MTRFIVPRKWTKEQSLPVCWWGREGAETKVLAGRIYFGTDPLFLG